MPDLEVGLVRQPPMLWQGPTFLEQLMRQRFSEHLDRIHQLATSGHGTADTFTTDWLPSTRLGLRPNDYAHVLSTMSDTAAQLPATAHPGSSLRGMFTGNENMEIPGDRMRYLEELMRALCKALVALHNGCFRLRQNITNIQDNALRHEMLTQTLPALVFPVTDATALAVEALFSHIHVRRQNVLYAARATAADCMLALAADVVTSQTLF